jgi:2-polyprenyl-3-methyl-5-hydroxy-6-metoxy-1,4-benzoquinol methylase
MLHHLPPLSFIATPLDRARSARIERVLSENAPIVRRISDACATLRNEKSASAETALERDVPILLAALRDSPTGWLARAARAIDHRVRSEGEEYLDREDVPAYVKSVSMRLLDWVNTAVGSYGVFRRAVTHALGAPRREAHVHDLAAGTGGFARYLAKFPPRGYSLTVSASDLDASYVAAGVRAAARDGLSVRFETRNALDLRDARGVDLFVCTQATHHLGAARLVRMISQAIAVSPRGLLVVDLMRSMSTAVGTGAVVAAVAPFPPLVYDGVQSVRRGFAPSELTLCARLAGATRIEARQVGPAYCALHAMA